MPVRKECPEGLNTVGIAEVPEPAMSSGSGIMSGFVGPEGWRETVSTALHHMPGMCTIWKLQRRVLLLEVTKPQGIKH